MGTWIVSFRFEYQTKNNTKDNQKLNLVYNL